MAQHEVKAALILRNDTSINWTVKNPILLKGETGVEIDTGLVKVGDGISTWQNLNYINEKVNLTNYVEKPVMTASGNLIAATINGELLDTGIPSTDIGILNIASTSILGGVLSSTSPNYIQVEPSGRMKLNQISTDLLYVPDGSELILNGGNA